MLQVSEADFLRAVVDLAQTYHWRVHHSRPAWTRKGWRTPVQGSPGFLDLVLVKHPQVIFAELKVKNRKITPAQRKWYDELLLCPGVEVYIWKPELWDDIVDRLRRC